GHPGNERGLPLGNPQPPHQPGLILAGFGALFDGGRDLVEHDIGPVLGEAKEKGPLDDRKLAEKRAVAEDRREQPLPGLGAGRGAHHLARWLGSIAAVLILVVGFAIWRLMQGPITLDWLAPYVEAGLERSGFGLKVAIGGVRLAIDRPTHQLHLWAEGVRLSL